MTRPDEQGAFPLNPGESADTGSDGVGGNYEIRFELDPNEPADAALNNDGDGANNLEEFLSLRNPLVNEHAVIKGLYPILFE